jgi:3-hydroxyacyl-CoA dehydrogenase / enoyl-CoA hydratase / 3-hydroxybutyryl-CoA epimerase
MEMNLENWKLKTDADDIIWLYLDTKNSKVNTLGSTVVSELEAIVDHLEKNPPVGMVLKSAKANGFIAGADVKQFQLLDDSDAAYELVRRSQILFDRIEAFKFPTVALIQGYCLGGGTELALACTYRIAQNDDKTKIALPEVLLGICPGWGGTVRLPNLVGVRQALPFIMTGRRASARSALRMGLVDAAPALPECDSAARYYILNKPKRRPLSMVDKIMAAGPVRPLVGKLFYKGLQKKHVQREQYPAPWAVVDNWVKYGAQGKAMEIEAKAISKLLVSDTSRSLVRIFFLQEALKALGKNKSQPVKHVHVIGAGAMGGDIAAWCALRGMRVTLQDRSIEQIAPAIARANKLYKRKLKKPRLINAALDRLQPDCKGLGVPKADVIIEAIFENLEAKQELFKDLEQRARPDAVLASNTSSIPLDDINVVLSQPERLVGIHFFNPVAKMPLVEVVRGVKTSEEIFERALAFVAKIAKTPLPVSSSPGFLVNRVLMPYLMEAMELLESGVSADVIDKAATKFGMPMGPIRLADQVGLDICLSVAENLSSHLGGSVPERLKKMVKDGQLGCKSGQGFYKYDKSGKRVKSEASSGSTKISTQDCTDRMVLRMLNESVACYREGVVKDLGWLDAGMIFGTGFAPFRGGPMHYAKARGIDEVVARLQHFADTVDKRFTPDAGWSQLTASESPASADTVQAE